MSITEAPARTPAYEQALAEADARKAARIERANALLKFTEMRLAAHKLLNDAAKLAGIGDIHRAQVEAAAKIAGSRFHTVHGEPSVEDATALAEDLGLICAAVDPLVRQIGVEAHGSFHGVDLTAFDDVVRNALESDAIPMLQTAVENAFEDAPSIDVNREHRTHPGLA